MRHIDTPGWDMHRMQRDTMADLGFFINHSAKDPVTRVMSTTALMLALCQAAGPAMISQPPGFLLIHAENNPFDPIDDLMKNLLGSGHPTPRPRAEQFEHNKRTMQVQMTDQENLLKQHNFFNSIYDAMGEKNLLTCPSQDKFQNLLRENHGGNGRAGWYADRHNPDYGWVTDDTGHSILRLDRAEDRRQFLEDVRQRPDKLILPAGYGAAMQMAHKKLSVAGSWPDWGAPLADGVVQNAIPLFFLPHTACAPLATLEKNAIPWIGLALAGEATQSNDNPVEASPQLYSIREPWPMKPLSRLRERLRYFPADYEFFVMRTIREMLPSCHRLVRILAPRMMPEQEQIKFSCDLFTRVIQGVCLSVESLGWHGYGWCHTSSLEDLRRVLRVIRERGSISKRELLRNQQWLNAEKRHSLLSMLAQEGVIMITNNEITAQPFADYWQRIIQRCFTELPNLKSWSACPTIREQSL